MPGVYPLMPARSSGSLVDMVVGVAFQPAFDGGVHLTVRFLDDSIHSMTMTADEWRNVVEFVRQGEPPPSGFVAGVTPVV